MSTHANGPAGDGAVTESQVGAGVSSSILPRGVEDRTQGTLLGPDLVVPSTPVEATYGALQADENASAWDRDGAYRHLTLLATSGVEFTADAMRETGHVLDDHAGRIGGLFMAASRSGLIECVGVATSRTGSRHGGLLRVWRGTAGVRGGDRG
jgi:hypothetical protein